MARIKSRTGHALFLMAVLAPMLTGIVVRTFAWMALLSDKGVINQTLISFGLIRQPLQLMYNETGIIIGLVHIYVPFMVLTLTGVIGRIDERLEQAAENLGASPFRAFLHVTLPLSKTGILGASVIITLPMFGDYYTPNIISGSPQTSMLGNQIDIFFHGGPQPAIGAALTLVLSVFLGVLMIYYMLKVAKASREAQA